jgi:CDP-diacylglycerol--serine O-phosphatidyltransferase
MSLNGILAVSFETWLDSILNLHPRSFIPFIGLIIPFFSIFRLAKFNIDTRQSDSFIGLNTPANTIFFTSFPLLLFIYQEDFLIGNTFINTIISPMILIPLIILMSILLVSEIPFFSFKFKHFKWKGNELRYLFLITCGILIPTLLVWSIPIIILLYIILSIVENLFIKKASI